MDIAALNSTLLSLAVTIVGGIVILIVEYKTHWFARAVELVGLDKYLSKEDGESRKSESLLEQQHEERMIEFYDSYRPSILGIAAAMIGGKPEALVIDKIRPVGLTHYKVIIKTLIPIYNEPDEYGYKNLRYPRDQRFEALVTDIVMAKNGIAGFLDLIPLPSQSPPEESEVKRKEFSFIRDYLLPVVYGFFSFVVIYELSGFVDKFYDQRGYSIEDEGWVVGLILTILLAFLPPYLFARSIAKLERDDGVVFMGIGVCFITWNLLILSLNLYPLQDHIEALLSIYPNVLNFLQILNRYLSLTNIQFGDAVLSHIHLLLIVMVFSLASTIFSTFFAGFVWGLLVSTWLIIDKVSSFFSTVFWVLWYFTWPIILLMSFAYIIFGGSGIALGIAFTLGTIIMFFFNRPRRK